MNDLPRRESRAGGCGRPRVSIVLSVCTVCVVALSAAAQVEGDSVTLDLLHFARMGSGPGILGGVVGMLFRVGDRPSSRRSFVRAVLAGWLMGMILSALGTWRVWPSGLVFAAAGLGGLVSEPAIRWALARTTGYLDRAADRALPPDGGAR